MSLITALNGLNHDIPLAVAVEMTARFRKHREEILKTEFQGRDILPLCETFQRAAFERILAQPSCVAVRTYLGMDAELKVRFIFVGVNDKGEDILPSAGLGAQSVSATQSVSADTTLGEDEEEDEGEIIEEGQRCPPHCPPQGPL